MCRERGMCRTCALTIAIHKQFELRVALLTLTKKLFGMANDSSIPEKSVKRRCCYRALHTVSSAFVRRILRIPRRKSREFVVIYRHIFCLIFPQLLLSRVSIIDTPVSRIHVKLRPSRAKRAGEVCVCWGHHFKYQKGGGANC